MNLKLNKYQKYALLIPIVPFIGIGISLLTDRYRFFLEYHWIYSTGKMFCFALWLLGFMWAIVNSVYIINNLKLKIKYRVMWLIINFATVIWFLIMIVILLLE
jgi:hypothetical protein